MSRKTSHWRRPAVLCALIVTMALPPVLHAQEDQEAIDQAVQDAIDRAFAEEITVTGSLIPRPNLENLSPVTVMGVEEITFSGLTRMEDLMATLPQAFSGQNSTVANGATGTATVDLRYLGSNRTLVLLNGRRLPPGNPSASYAPDLNSIPGAMLKRVDVLTGGASAVYGSDAVAGVVNFVLDTEFEGMRGGLNYSFYQHDNSNAFAQQINREAGFDVPDGSTTDGDGINLDLAFGGKFADGRGHASAYITYRKLDAVTKSNRDYTNCSVWGTSSGPMCGGSTTGFPTRLRPYYSVNHPDPDLADTQIGDFIVEGGGIRPRTATDVFNYGPYNHIQRPDERWNAGAFLNYTFNDHVEGYMEVMLMNDYTDAQIAPTGNFNVAPNINCDNPMLSDEQYQTICVEGGYSDDEYATMDINRRSLEGGPRSWRLEHNMLRVVAGIRGAINDQWNYDFYGLHAQTSYLEKGTNDINVARMQDALDVIEDPETGEWVCRSGNTGCVPWNIFADNGGVLTDDYRQGVTPEAIDYMSTVAMVIGGTETQVLNATFNGDLEDYGMALPSATEGIQMAIGGEVRHERMWTNPDEVNIVGTAGSGGGAEAIDADFTVQELFLEGLVPLVQDASWAHDFSLELGYRRSDYSTSGAADAYKLLLSYAPTPDFKFRASYNRAIRSANIFEMYRPAGLNLNGSFDPCAGANPAASLEECMRTGVTADQYGNIAPNTANQYNTFEGGNPNLDPEVADTFTYGIVITPQSMPGFTATVDYYDISIEDAIGPMSYGVVMNVCTETGDPAYCNLIHRDARGSLWNTRDGYITTTYQNISNYYNRGVDLSLSYMKPIGDAGLISADLVGTYFLENSFQQADLFYDCVGYFGFGSCGQPNAEWKHRARFTWETSFNATFSLGWRYIGEVTNEFGSPDPDLGDPEQQEFYSLNGIGKIDAYNYFDLVAAYNFNDNIQWNVGVNNLLDKEPPLAPDYADDTFFNMYATYDPLGRYIHTSLRFTF